MSRSFKKQPITKDSIKGGKRQANQVVRRYTGEIANGKSYKKLYESYDISDWSWRQSFQDYLAEYDADRHEYLNAYRPSLERHNPFNEVRNYATWRREYLSK